MKKDFCFIGPFWLNMLLTCVYIVFAVIAMYQTQVVLRTPDYRESYMITILAYINVLFLGNQNSAILILLSPRIRCCDSQPGSRRS